jgi:hypothetical protein
VSQRRFRGRHMVAVAEKPCPGSATRVIEVAKRLENLNKPRPWLCPARVKIRGTGAKKRFAVRRECKG